MNFPSDALHHFQEKFNETPSVLIEGAWDAPKTLILRLIRQKTSKNILVLTPESRSNKVLDNAPFFNLTHLFELPPLDAGEEEPSTPDILGKRFEILHHLATSMTPSVIICSLQAALQKVPDPSLFKPLCRVWKIGDTLEWNQLPSLLTDLGYRRSPIVVDKGEFAIRGSICDLFPVSAPEPYRVELFDGIIESIRSFDPIGQKSVVKMEKFFLSPAEENPSQALSATILTYLGSNTIVVFDELLALEDKWIKLQAGISSITISFPNLLDKLSELQTVFFSQTPVEELSEVRLEKKVGRSFYSGKTPFQPLTFDCFGRSFKTLRWHSPFLPISDISLEKKDLDIQFVCEHEAQKNVLQHQFPQITHPKFVKGYLSQGFGTTDSSTVLLPITEVTHSQKIRREKWRSTYHTPPSDFHELAPGDIVVHFHHGIGKYLGMEKKPNNQGVETEFLILEYAKNGKLYVPVSNSYLISKYIGSGEETSHAPLHTLGTKQWQKAKNHAYQSIAAYAHDLLKIAAEREVHGGFAFPPDSLELMQFEEEFPYPETEDQLRAIFDIKQDMSSAKAMDRLLCGDVGYGKTEVAMRAAFKAVVDGKKQVAVLVPTTILSLQHQETFSERMKNTPVVIKAISRLQSPKEIEQILEETQEGKIDILIGTHRILSPDVKFKDLGLIVIDEEQRFGVRAKEHLKTLKTGVDCLTLTATPIPRTLYLSIVGARDISLINTPPQDRLPIKTIVAEKTEDTIRAAITRELSRDGQLFFIHNRVESIDLASEELQKLVPQAKIITGHGQMSSDELDTLFHTFKNGKADILVSTTIIENGVDLPNANTIIVDRADRLGLADLYQLRGRVGRSDRPAYAYFLVPHLKEIHEISRRRLHTLIEAQGYGAGMKIARRDLELRGFGDLLGKKQSGDVATIGFHLYCKLLRQAVNSLKKQQNLSFFETKIDSSYDARLPETYIAELSIRLEIYHRFGDASTLEEVDSLFHELKDRFGTPPIPALWLYHLMRIRVLGSQHRYTLLKFNSHTLETEKLAPKGTIKSLHTLKPPKSPADLEKQVFPLLIS